MSTDPIRRALVSHDSLSRAVSAACGRVLDVLVASIALGFFAPLIGLICVAIWQEGDGPILFRHARVGRQGKKFVVLKFRTMITDSDQVLRQHLAASDRARGEWTSDYKLRDDPRVTRIGGFLRSSSLDELPQLINVLRGEMSIVGPRPIVEDEIERYGAFFTAYCSIRPGITGVWQVSGRNDVSYSRRVEMDALYARKKSVLLDLRIMLLTIPAVLTRRGSY